jgi:hypothetical protein
MEYREVQCVNKTSRQDPHERIANIGGVLPDGSRWKFSEGAAIKKIEDKECGFYTIDHGGKRVAVVIATRLGYKYLKTEADGERPDNLLALPDCP